MARPIGIPKTGGRKKGTLNKKSYVLSEQLEALDFDVVEQLIECLNDPEYKPQKPQILLKLLDYLYPKCRPQTLGDGNLSNPSDNTFIFEIVEPNGL